MQRETLRLFWTASSRYPVRLALVLLMPALTVLSGSFLGPYIIAIFFNRLQAGQVRLSESWGLIIAYVATQLWGEVIGWRISLWAAWTLETAAQRDLHARIFAHLSQQSLGFHNDRFGGSLVSQTNKFVSAYERFWDTIIFTVIPVLTSIGAATVILSTVFWQYAAFLFVLSGAFFAVVVVSARYMATLNTREAQASTRITGRLADVVTNIAAVKGFGRESDELHEYHKLLHSWRGDALAAMRGFLGVSTVYSLLLLTGNVTAFVAALIAVERGGAAAGTVFLCVTYTFTVTQQLWELNHIMRNYNRAMGDAHDMTEILGMAPTVRDAAAPRELEVRRGALAVDNILFAHGDRADGRDDAPLFEDFTLHVAAGERVGLVGRSGSGKTTLTRLLLRFADLQAGRIAIDGQDIAAMRQTELRRAIAYVPQEPLLFHRSLRENIAYGSPDATDEQVRAAAGKAHALEFIDALPEGLSTLVGERGVKLSGGQRQRIAIARAILKDAPILVLDEATSALDSESERLIRLALEEAMTGRTTVVIAHRLSTVEKLDRIVVLEAGRIIEVGTHAELLRAGGTYARMWQLQSGGFLDDYGPLGDTSHGSAAPDGSAARPQRPVAVA